MALSTSWKTLLPDILEKTNAHTPLAKTVTLTGGTTTTGVSSAHIFAGTGSNAYDGVRMFVLNDAGGASAAPEGEERRVSVAGFTGSTGTWTVGTAYTAALASGDTVVFIYGFAHQDVLDAANRVISAHYWPRYSVLSLVNDANMEDSSATAATDWPDVDGTPTQTKETTEVLTGKQSLKIVTTSVDHSVRSISVPVTEGEQLYLSVPVKCEAGSLRVQVYDVTNSAELAGATVDEVDWTTVWLQSIGVPGGCQNVQVRFISKTASTTAYVDHVSLLSPDVSIYALPHASTTAIYTDAEHVEGVYSQRVSLASAAGDSYKAFTDLMQPWGEYEPLRDYAGVTAQRLQVRAPTGDPLWVMGRAKDSELTALTSTTFAIPDTIIYGTVAELMETQCGRLSGRDRQMREMEAQRMRMRYHATLPQWMDRPQAVIGGFETVRVP